MGMQGCSRCELSGAVNQGVGDEMEAIQVRCRGDEIRHGCL